MAPSSGARSGTNPSRSERGAGDGRVGSTKLRCGHETDEPPVVTGQKTLYRCPEGCGFVKKR
jgi:hypothetical protein